MKYVNINADASYNEKHLLGGYGIVIKGEDFKVNQHGMLKGNPKSSTEAEIMALEYAMRVLLAQPGYKGIERVIIYTDCQGAIAKILRPKTPYENRVHLIFKKLSNKNGNASLKHVKSHTDNEDIASSMNRWCDEKARKALQDRIQRNIE